ncbi:chitobiase/beta-hexosaminidase C-terminal domain-containing protein [Paenibacillus daejeonensis]|uniref:chitobiase/beta-hexosaminidase C-terminal domain-containing protein n=1 Tax=Paenibacillus daejeonensis TaxID=135193 RepID=UPI00146CDBE8|nr:chitobiase/beta-hexosaminidase C-terminal domain-containing protein [Paenibacillus daejeonensis]
MTHPVDFNRNMYKLQPKYLINNFSFDMMAATVTEGHDVVTTGNFRTTHDLSGLSWETEDLHSHADFKYPTNPDFSNVQLSYTYQLSGDVPDMNAGQAPALTIETLDGGIHYVRLWNYVVNRPVDDWEAGSKQVYPANRTPGEATGKRGQVVLSFNNLYAGWQPYVYDNSGRWVSNPDWVKIPVHNIKRIVWPFVSQSYDASTPKKFLPGSNRFEIRMSNWTVTGDTFLRSEPSSHRKHNVRMTDDYDDIYHLTPERVVSEYIKLGYSGSVNMYVGASHFYDKQGIDGTMTLIDEEPFNDAFTQWYSNYIKRLKTHHFTLIHSISMENVDAPASWWQRSWDGTPATSGWMPTPHFLSFTHSEVQAYYKKYTLGLAQMSVDHGLKPVVQLGEPWWWFMEGTTGQPPTFYDEATKALYKKEKGKDMHVFKSSHDSIEEHEDLIHWLQDKNGDFALMLRDALKQAYPQAEFTVLFFTPSVIDKDRVPHMMSIVNFPQKQWAYPNLDFFMLEDYDYLIDDQMEKHAESLRFVQAQLGYPEKRIHYFAGFVPEQDQRWIWNNINRAINNGFNQRFQEVYVWAYAQIKRDSWTPPDFVLANRPSGPYVELFDLTLSSTADRLVYTIDESTPTLTHGTVYRQPIPINQSTRLRVAAISGGSVTEVYDFSYKIEVE